MTTLTRYVLLRVLQAAGVLWAAFTVSFAEEWGLSRARAA
jgi:peptide/nickel transport system permease protein